MMENGKLHPNGELVMSDRRREARARHSLAKAGLRLRKSLARDPSKPSFKLYGIVDASGSAQSGNASTLYTLSLAEVEAFARA